MSDLAGRVALVTGASRGIGKAIAIALARAGADVGVNYLHREAEAQQTVAEINALGRRAVAVQADVSNSAEVSRLVASVEAELGPIDILVNNAGVIRLQPLQEITERDFDELISINLKSAFLVTQAVLPGMRARRWGRIINLSSVAAQLGKRHRSGPHRDRDGDEQPKSQAGPDPRWPVRDG
jgi:3-oxoacyl-[acyl-carrier protein] reductase